MREPTPERLLEAIEARRTTVADQWQVQILAKIQCRTRVIVHTSHIHADELSAAHLESTDDLQDTILGALALADPVSSRVCVLPEGPVTIPYIG